MKLCSPAGITAQFKNLSSLYASKETGDNPVSVVSASVGMEKAKSEARLTYWAQAEQRAAQMAQAKLQAAI